MLSLMKALSRFSVQMKKSCLVAVPAYYKAEARGFKPGLEMEDWLAAEAEVTQ
jgi:hypothetical protein